MNRGSFRGYAEDALLKPWNQKVPAGGDLIIWDGFRWSRLSMLGDLTITGAGVVAIGSNKVLDTMIRQGAAMTVIGRSANSTGNVADIATSADGDVLRRNGTTLGFGTIVAAAIGSGTIATARLGSGSPGSTTFLRGDQTYAVPPGQLTSIQPFMASASGTYTKPAGINAIWVRMFGAGGGGGGVTGGVGSAAGAGGGAAGAYCEKYISSPNSTYSYVVGAGGAGGTAGNNAGTAGTSTTFGTSLLTAPGGGGGDGMAAGQLKLSKGGVCTIATGGDVNGCGAPGDTGACVTTAIACGGDGGSCLFGGGGRGSTTEQVGAAGVGNGAGGAGATSTGTGNHAGGAGVDGAIIVFEFS